MNQSDRERSVPVTQGRCLRTVARGAAGTAKPAPIGPRAELPAGRAALCQEAGIVTIVAPEVRMQGAQAIERRRGVTAAVSGAGLDRLS